MYQIDRNGFGGYWLGYKGKGYDIYESSDGFKVKSDLDNEKPDYVASTLQEAIDWVMENI